MLILLVFFWLKFLSSFTKWETIIDVLRLDLPVPTLGMIWKKKKKTQQMKEFSDDWNEMQYSLVMLIIRDLWFWP